MLEEIIIELSQWCGSPHKMTIKISRGNNTNFDEKGKNDEFFYERNITLKNEKFDKLVEKYQINKWKRKYANTEILDGINGEILLKYPEKNKKISVMNSFPEGIDNLFKELHIDLEVE